MTKLLGGIIIISSVIYIAYYPMIVLKHRIHMLFSFISALQWICRELNVNFSSIPEIMDLLQNTCNSRVKPLFYSVGKDLAVYGAANFEKSWVTHLRKFKTNFHNEEFELIENLGRILGQYSSDEQVKALEQVICILEKNEQISRERYNRETKLYAGCGAAVGIMLVVLLI